MAHPLLNIKLTLLRNHSGKEIDYEKRDSNIDEHHSQPAHGQIQSVYFEEITGGIYYSCLSIL